MVVNPSPDNSRRFIVDGIFTALLQNITGTRIHRSDFVPIPREGAMLTRKQHELLMFIHERMKEAGIPPSFDEMKDALDLRSKSGIHRLITALEERGFNRRLPNRARALEVIKLPDSMNPSLGGRKARFEPSVIDGSLGRVAQMPARQNNSSSSEMARPVVVPVMGRIAAGTPIEAGIFDGDTVLIKKQDSASTGEIVVALVDDEEATLKRLRRRGNAVALEAANPSYETRIFPPDRVKVQGRLVGLLRKY